jgi:hypothetical protein
MNRRASHPVVAAVNVAGGALFVAAFVWRWASTSKGLPEPRAALVGMAAGLVLGAASGLMLRWHEHIAGRLALTALFVVLLVVGWGLATML